MEYIFLFMNKIAFKKNYFCLLTNYVMFLCEQGSVTRATDATVDTSYSRSLLSHVLRH